MRDTETEKAWDWIVERGIATGEELRLVASIIGYNIDAMNSVLYSRTGYRSIEQIEECE